MIKFTDRQLKVPRFMRPVYLVTGGQSQYGRAFPEKRTEELCIDAFNMAAEFIGMTAAELKGYIHTCYYGHFADHFGDQLLGEAVIHDRLGLDPLGNIGVKTGGATGGSTIWEAAKAVASGYSDCCLAMGWERMDEVPTDEGNNYIARRSLPPVYRQLQPLPVHRLDQYTSGVFCIALNPATRQHLIEQLKAHTMKREYVAYVEGRPARRQGTWRQWLQLSDNELRQHVLSEKEARTAPSTAVEAITHYEVIDEFPLTDGAGVVSKLRLRLETGRKHQIRAQAAYAGLPLIGDRAYHPKYSGQTRDTPSIEFSRQALHAEVLSLEHPAQPGTPMTWTAALPKDLRQLEATLRFPRLQ